MAERTLKVAAWIMVACMCAVACVFLCCRAHAMEPSVSDAAAQPVPDNVANGLKISIRPSKTAYAAGEKITLSVELCNVGSTDLVLNLGMILGGGRKQYPTAVELVLIDSSGEKAELLPRGPSGVAGSMDDFIVPLPVGAAYTLNVNLSDYWNPKAKIFRIEPAAGEHAIAAKYVGKSAEYTARNTGGRVNLGPVWTGEVMSAAVSFSVAAR